MRTELSTVQPVNSVIPAAAWPLTFCFSGVADAQVSSDLREYLAGYGCNGALTAAIVAVGDTLRNYAADATVRRGAEGPVGLVSGCTVRLADGRL